jgi:hypothetical protein
MTSTPVKLVIDWCSTNAARRAVMSWHYSKCYPSFGSVRFGVWENDRFVGAVIFNNGVARRSQGLADVKRHEECELVRVALDTHATPTSRIVMIALRKLHAFAPQLRLAVSFADSAQGHVGSIYQAMGWTYVGQSTTRGFILNGKQAHLRTVTGKYHKKALNKMRATDPSARAFQTDPKFRYYYPLDKSLQPILARMALPYPKKTSGRLTSEARGDHLRAAVQSRPVRSTSAEGV